MKEVSSIRKSSRDRKEGAEGTVRRGERGRYSNRESVRRGKGVRDSNRERVRRGRIVSNSNREGVSNINRISVSRRRHSHGWARWSRGRAPWWAQGAGGRVWVKQGKHRDPLW